MAQGTKRHLTPEHRQKLSESAIRRFHAEREQRIVEPDQRRCSRCEGYKPITEFSTLRKKLRCGLTGVYPDSWCRPCRAKDAKERYDRKVAEGVMPEIRRRWYEEEDPEKRREMWRQCKAARRRKEGRPYRGPRKPIPQRREYVSVGPLASFLEGIEVPEGVLSSSTVRRIYAVTSGEQQEISLETVDQILLGLGCQELLGEMYPTPGRIPYEYLPES